MWGEKFDRQIPPGLILKVRDEVAEGLAAALDAFLKPGVRQRDCSGASNGVSLPPPLLSPGGTPAWSADGCNRQSAPRLWNSGVWLKRPSPEGRSVDANLVLATQLVFGSPDVDLAAQQVASAACSD